MRSRRILLAASLLTCAACSRGDKTSEARGVASALASALTGGADSSASGKLHAEGGDLGTFDTVLSDCQSGEYKGFFGVDLFPKGADHMSVRYVHDEATGEVVKVAYPSKPDTAKVFDHDAKCAVLEGHVEKTNVSTRVAGRGNIRHLNGHVKFDCKHSNGAGHVTGEATFLNCH